MELTDPTHEPVQNPGLFDRIALSMINDERDLPFVRLAAFISVTTVPFGIALFIPGVFRWWLGAALVAFNALVHLDRYTLMLHNTSHRPLFKRQFKVLNRWIPEVLGPFFGQTPNTYFVHHMGMHHKEENLEHDLSSTMKYDRDRPLHFLQYWADFFFLGMFKMSRYFKAKGQEKMVKKMLIGEIGWYLGVIALCFVNWQATLFVFVVPMVLIRFLMMAGNWAQHAFIDPERPEVEYASSITCINSRYNRRAFNDGYHIGHHVKASRHWTEMPGDFNDNLERYGREGAIVFRGVDFFQVWLLLMFGRYDRLADHYVPLPGQSDQREEIIAMLKSRTKACARPSAG